MVRIITDSLSDITLERGKELGIDIMCLNVRFGDEEYVCGKEMSNEQFYEKLETSPNPPSSSAVNPAAFTEIFNKYLDAGDEIVAVMFSSSMSATYQNAVIAAEEINSPKLHVIDTQTGLNGEGLLVEYAVKLRDEGKSADEIEKSIRDILPKIRVYLVVDTMEYLKRGGRISASKALVGQLFHVHPVMQILPDGARPIDKVKGKKSSSAWLVNKLVAEPASTDFPIVIEHSNAVDRAAALQSEIVAAGITNDFITNCIGPIIGTHAGPNCLSIGYVIAE
ncbi:MAG: DegV family protein [Eubacterium sp.]|nr:DegV family protein [Eubacterium sp.]